MKTDKLRTLIFLALCCNLGLFAKRIVNPFANIITDALHIPGGVGTSFSLMLLVLAAVLTSYPLCGTIMGVVQSGLALGLGMVGSMGALSPIGYIAPGLIIDAVLWITKKTSLQQQERMLLANTLAAPTTAFAAHLIVFRLNGATLLLYLSVSAVSGAFCGALGARLAKRLSSVVTVGRWNKYPAEEGRPA